VIELLSAEAKPRDDGLPELVAALADQMGRCAERMRVRRREIEHMTSIAAVAQAARELNATTDAARQVIAADVVELWEPERDELVCTATAGADPPAGGLRMGREASGAGVAFASAQRFFVPDVSGQPAISARMIERTGARSVMFEPVASEGEVIAVLVLIWTTPTPGIGRQSEAMLGLLSGEAAAAIGRADLLHELEELARTDSLTGIANRRTWEAELRRELVRARRVERPLCVAIVDLDFFKRFNDTRGHQDGDRLLKSSAAAWSGALREADFLALRRGGVRRDPPRLRPRGRPHGRRSPAVGDSLGPDLLGGHRGVGRARERRGARRPGRRGPLRGEGGRAGSHGSGVRLC